MFVVGAQVIDFCVRILHPATLLKVLSDLGVFCSPCLFQPGIQVTQETKSGLFLLKIPPPTPSLGPDHLSSLSAFCHTLLSSCHSGLFSDSRVLTSQVTLWIMFSGFLCCPSELRCCLLFLLTLSQRLGTALPHLLPPVQGRCPYCIVFMKRFV